VSEPQRRPIAHGELNRPGAKPHLRQLELPPWTGWRWTSDAARARRWIEQYLVVPTGSGAGFPIKVAGYERRIIEELYDSLGLFVSIPAGNGKTTLLAAVALERMCRGDPYVEVDVLATKEDQAGILVETAKRMVEACPELVPLFAWHAHDAILEYRLTGSTMTAHPAKLAAVQGLNYTLAIIDEVGFARDDIAESLIARVGKRPDAHVIGIGTPGFEGNMLQRIHTAAADAELPSGVRYMEWAAPDGCDVNDRDAWRVANPAIRAGFLRADALAVQAAMLSEREFRTYHLGQWQDESSGWLPDGAWEACPPMHPPPDGSPIVVAVEGTYRRSLAVMCSTMEGDVFFGYAAEAATDEQLSHALGTLAERFDVVEVVYPRRIRPGLFAELGDQGLPVRAWDGRPDQEAASTNELYRAIVEGRIAHDHDDVTLAAMAAVRVRWAVDGSIRLSRPDKGAPVDAAFAARAAWWRASQLAAEYDAGVPVIY
jgi:phage terminase large subunit-like protein